MAQDENPREEEQEANVPDDDRPQSFDRLTASEQREGDSIKTRVAREEPEVQDRDGIERPAHLIEPNDGDGDEIGELVAREVTDRDDVADEDLSPEERAMSIRDEGDEA